MDNQEHSEFDINQDQYDITRAQKFEPGLIFGDAFKILRKGFLQFSAILIFISFPLAILSTVVIAQSPEQMANLSIEALSRQLFSMWFFILLSLFPNILIIISAGDQIENNRKPFHDVFVRSLSRYHIVVITTIGFAIASFLGFVMLIIPGIIIMILFYFYIQSVALRKQGVFGSFIYSYELVKSNLLSCFLMGLAVTITSVILFSPFIIMSYFDPANIALQVLQSCFSTAIGLFITILATVTFFNLESLYRLKNPGEMVPAIQGIARDDSIDSDTEDY